MASIPSLPYETRPYAAPSERVRLTISVSPEVHRTFQRLAEAGSMSVSRAMGDWLQDTLEAAEFMASTMEKARAAPKMVIRELHGYALGLSDETGQMLQRMRGVGGAAPSARGAGAGGAPETSAPRPVIRGVKGVGKPSPKKAKGRR